MIRFECDYAEGAHPRILQALMETNEEQTQGYGMDVHCDHARQLIREACGVEHASVEFQVGGTQTNATVISACLKPYQGVLCAESGHINVHETGAIEAGGHKVLAVKREQTRQDDGKLTAGEIEQAWVAHMQDANHEHMVQPGMVYISQPTENGTLYTATELEAISKVCHSIGIPLYIDGARCGYGLMAPGNDVTLKEYAKYADVFYIGGTKVGALFGEAVVIVNDDLKKDFRYYIKQHGGMLAKGRLLGIQFETLFEDGLYQEISAHAIKMALRIRQAFEDSGVKMFFSSVTNQQFPILTKEQQSRLAEKYAFSFWEQLDEEHVVVRFCTSWATKEEQVAMLENDIRDICGSCREA